MRKKWLALALSMAMVVGSITGCGGSDSNKDASNSSKSNDSAKVETVADGGGKVLNIYVWNTEFKERFEKYYPDYNKDTQSIGDVKVKFVTNTNEGGVYQKKLDAALKKQDSASADDKIDMFLCEMDYVNKYTNTDMALDIKSLGLTDDDLSQMYDYTKQAATKSDGTLRAVSWQGCPGVLIYNREAAKAVLGTDDPAEVQKSVSDWDTFTATAEKMKAAGYNMVSSVNDTYRVYSNNVSSKWVQDGKIVIDDNLMKWVDDSKKMVDAKETGTFDLWSDDWSKGFYPDGKVFCYFGPAWLINFSMAADTDGSIANQGGWGATEGPQGFFWGGTWICGATGTDNASLVKDIILKMTTDEDIMKEIVVADDDFVNNKPAMEAMAADTSYQSKVLGGQNPLAMFCAGAEKIDLSNLSAYDQGCNEEFQHAMKNYFDGKASLDDALDLFYKGVEEKYPELTH